MLDWINNAILALADPVLNWLLRLPADLALVIVAAGTGAILALCRLFTTNQDLLRRCVQDKRRLRELTGEAKRQKDKEAVARYRTTRNTIGMMTMKEEGWPLLAAVVPIALLGTWCFQRLAFVPPPAGQPVSLKARFPVSAVGELAHVVPQEGVREVSGEDPAAAAAGSRRLSRTSPALAELPQAESQPGRSRPGHGPSRMRWKSATRPSPWRRRCSSGSRSTPPPWNSTATTSPS